MSTDDGKDVMAIVRRMVKERDERIAELENMLERALLWFSMSGECSGSSLEDEIEAMLAKAGPR